MKPVPDDDGDSSSEIGAEPERAATCTTDGDTRSKISIAPRSASENAPRCSIARATEVVDGASQNYVPASASASAATVAKARAVRRFIFTHLIARPVNCRGAG